MKFGLKTNRYGAPELLQYRSEGPNPGWCILDRWENDWLFYSDDTLYSKGVIPTYTFEAKNTKEARAKAAVYIKMMR